MSKILERGLKAQAKALREFGYKDVTTDFVRRAHAAWLSGKEAEDVAAMFCERAFQDYPEIFGRSNK